MKSRNEVLAAIQKVAVDKLDCSPLHVVESASFTNDLGADSLDALEICMDVERELNIEIPSHAFEQINTVGELVNYIVEGTLP